MELLSDSENMPVIQGSDSWNIARKNRFSASTIQKLIPGTTKAQKAKVTDYIIEKAYGCFLEMPIIKPTYAAMRRGIMLEEEARIEFLRQYKIVPEDWTIAKIEEVFNVRNCYLDDECKFHLISPDGYNGGFEHLFDGVRFGTEFKTAEDTAKYSRFCRYVTDNASLKEFDAKYYWQVMDSLMCSGADYWWFAYYLPEMQRGYDIRAIKIYPDEAEFKVLRDALNDAMPIYKEAYEFELSKFNQLTNE